MDSTNQQLENSRPPVRYDLVGIVLAVWFLSEVIILYLTSSNDPTWGQSFRLGQAAIAGFWLACGRPRWWIRLPVVVVAVVTLGLSDIRWGTAATTVLSVTAVMVAGWTFLGRMLFSVVTREASPHQRFSILGVMLATALVAAMIVGLRYGLNNNGFPANDARILTTLFHVVMIGSAYVLQCAVWWARSRRMFVGMTATALLTAIGAPFIAFGLHRIVVDDLPPLEELLTLHWVGDISIWIFLVPVQIILMRLGTNLIADSWMQHETGEEAIDSLSSDHE